MCPFQTQSKPRFLTLQISSDGGGGSFFSTWNNFRFLAVLFKYYKVVFNMLGSLVARPFLGSCCDDGDKKLFIVICCLVLFRYYVICVPNPTVI